MLVNTQLRRVHGGFIARTYLGDRWAWRLFDNNREPLPMTAKTATEAKARLATILLLSVIDIPQSKEEEKAND